jgi:hypothetical protein
MLPLLPHSNRPSPLEDASVVSREGGYDGVGGGDGVPCTVRIERACDLALDEHGRAPDTFVTCHVGGTTGYNRTTHARTHHTRT